MEYIFKSANPEKQATSIVLPLEIGTFRLLDEETASAGERGWL